MNDGPILYVVSCGARKIWDADPLAGPTPARDAYAGSFFKTNRQYVERFLRPGERWVILSGKYGFIDPDYQIPDNYNVSFGSADAIGESGLRKQAELMELDAFAEVVVLGSRRYAAIASAALPFATVRRPWADRTGGIGYMMAELKYRIARGVP